MRRGLGHGSALKTDGRRGRARTPNRSVVHRPSVDPSLPAVRIDCGGLVGARPPPWLGTWSGRSRCEIAPGTSLLAEEVHQQASELVWVLDRRHVPASPEHVQADVGQVVEQGQGRRP